MDQNLPGRPPWAWAERAALMKDVNLRSIMALCWEEWGDVVAVKMPTCLGWEEI